MRYSSDFLPFYALKPFLDLVYAFLKPYVDMEALLCRDNLRSVHLGVVDPGSIAFLMILCMKTLDLAFIMLFEPFYLHGCIWARKDSIFTF